MKLNILRVFHGMPDQDSLIVKVIIRDERERKVQHFEWNPLQLQPGDERIFVLEPVRDENGAENFRFSLCPWPLKIQNGAIDSPVHGLMPPVSMSQFEELVRKNFSNKKEEGGSSLIRRRKKGTVH